MPPFIIILYVFKNKYGYFLICANIIVSTRCLISSGYSSAFASNSVTSFFVKQNFKFILYKDIRKKEKQKNISLEDVENELITENSLEENIFLQEDKLDLLKKIQKLNEETRNVMYLKLLGGLKNEEIAEVMNKTPNWVRVTYFRGKQKIKEDKS